MQKQQPIGFFDSGVGGTSIWKEVHKLLPKEHTIYLADSKYAPYGQKSKEEILKLSIKNVELLLQKDCKLIIVACNTATTNAISYLRKHYNVPFIGIEPAIKPAALYSKTGAIGILATKGTLSSSLFAKRAKAYTTNITTVEQVGEGLVDLVEQGKIDSKEMNKLLQAYLRPMLEKNIDHLVLGCTHYPYLIPKIKQIIGNNIKIIDSGKAVAKQTKNILTHYNLLSENKNKKPNVFYSNTNKKVLSSILNVKNTTDILVKELDF